ncbi:MFS general substrate transporter [Hesseltinella vesiculosa]|uniref:MFS general substrate transporter n=1 Tax=Hesseltinella vesiculosa TaxID=101127 RepID=A0A1X2GEJ6_9FUNG|nr:MFS general substrate transporter [Hesseltinella vesiculosa]
MAFLQQNTSQIPMFPYKQSSRPQSLTSIDDLEFERERNRFYDDDLTNPEYTRQLEKKLVRKLDLLILPMICAIDFLQFLDKSTINYAAAFTFKQDIDINGTQYSLLGSMFYVGYLVYQIPNNYFLQHVSSVSKYIGTIVFLWGGILVAMAFGKNFAQMLAMRFLLGMFEAGIYPALTLLVSTFYRRSEQVVRLGAFWLCNGFALFLGGLIAYGIGHIQNPVLHTWQWIMLITGVVTCAMGVVAYFFLIDNPKSAGLGLNAEFSYLVEERARDNAVLRTTTFKREQIIEAIKEPRLWYLAIATMSLNLQNGAITIYNTQLIATFGFDSLQAVLLSTGSGLSDIMYILVSVYVVRTYKNSALYMAMALMVMDVVGLLLLLLIPVDKLKLIGFYLSWPYAACFVLILNTIANNVSGFSKKIFYTSVCTVFYSIGNVAGPFFMVESQKPSYYGAMIGYCCAGFLCVVCLGLARLWMAKLNKEKERMQTAEKPRVPLTDITDREDPYFMYML